MLTVKIDYRELGSAETSRKPIGLICPICQRLQFNEFWNELRQRKEDEKRDREQRIGYRKKPSFHERYKCFKCGFKRPILRKLPISPKHPMLHWKGKCPKCGDTWTQNHPY